MAKSSVCRFITDLVTGCPNCVVLSRYTNNHLQKLERGRGNDREEEGGRVEPYCFFCSVWIATLYAWSAREVLHL